MATSGNTCDYTDSCQKCKLIEKQYKKRCSEANLIVLHTDRSHLCSGKKCKEKKKSLQKLEQIISALRNSGGGHVLVHINGQQGGDRYLEHFDESITRSFTYLIEDGQLYVDAYERRWLSEVAGFETRTDVLLVTVTGTAGISTVDFNTKVNNDIENVRPHYLHVAEILFNQPIEQSATSTEFPTVRGLIDIQQLHENRKIEIKAFKPKETGISTTPSAFVNYIWNDLKLKDNLTSMTKVPGGGSYFVGISEAERVNEGYKTKIPSIDGFVLADVQVFAKSLENKVKESSVVLLGGIFSDVPDDLLKVQFHPLPNTSPQRYVLEVAVRHFNGIVFYDREGPRAYTIQNKKISRIDKTEWLKRFENSFKDIFLKRA